MTGSSPLESFLAEVPTTPDAALQVYAFSTSDSYRCPTTQRLTGILSRPHQAPSSDGATLLDSHCLEIAVRDVAVLLDTIERLPAVPIVEQLPGGVHFGQAAEKSGGWQRHPHCARDQT